jgi:hypothetical protein
MASISPETIRELNLTPFNRFRLVNLLDEQFPGIFQQDVGVWEKYTLGQHTLMVLGQYEKYFSAEPLPGGFTHPQFRLFLAVHDMGKPAAVANQEKHRQSQYNIARFDEVYPEGPFIQKDRRDTLRSLLTDDPVGHYLQSVMKWNVPMPKALDHCVASIKNMHDQQQPIGLSSYGELLLTYFRCDAGSYTLDACGLKSLDHLFDFSGGRIAFKGKAKELIEHLSAAFAEA